MRALPFTALALLSSLAVGCSDDDGANAPSDSPEAFSLAFTAIANGEAVGCTDVIDGLGPDGQHRAGLSDLRFYVSNLVFLDADGNPVDHSLDDDEFQYAADAGSVALIDLTGNTEGTCADSAIAFAEGTARTNDTIEGTTLVGEVASVSFDIGVPQALMKEVISANTPEAAPSPLDEMYWSWATGYRHFVMNATVENNAGETGDGYLHVGSRDCGGDGELALENQASCGFVNNPSVSLDGFDLATGVVAVDVTSLMASLDFVAPIYDLDTFEIIGEGPGLECHSSPMQPDCATVFDNLGLDMDTGGGTAANNDVFVSL